MDECNECNVSGQPVTLNLVRHHLTEPWRRDLEGKRFTFCEEPNCSVIYFSDTDDVFRSVDLRRPPAYKTGRGSDLLCFCFDATGDDVMAEDGDTLPYIRERVRKGECACDVLNPSGACCLGSISQWQKAHGKSPRSN